MFWKPNKELVIVFIVLLCLQFRVLWDLEHGFFFLVTLVIQNFLFLNLLFCPGNKSQSFFALFLTYYLYDGTLLCNGQYDGLIPFWWWRVGHFGMAKLFCKSQNELLQNLARPSVTLHNGEYIHSNSCCSWWRPRNSKLQIMHRTPTEFYIAKLFTRVHMCFTYFSSGTRNVSTPRKVKLSIILIKMSQLTVWRTKNMAVSHNTDSSLKQAPLIQVGL